MDPTPKTASPSAHATSPTANPTPEIFLTAAHELGVEPRYAMVIEDASAGVQAAKAGGMAAIGIA